MQTTTLVSAPSFSPPAGWVAIGAGRFAETGEEITLTSAASGETGLASEEVFVDVRLSFEVRLDAGCRFIAKLHHAARGEPMADSYHLLAAPGRVYLARQHLLLSPLSLARGRWQHVEMTWRDGLLTITLDAGEACRCADAALVAGHCFVGLSGGAAALRSLKVESLSPASQPILSDWSAAGNGTLAKDENVITLTAGRGEEIYLVSVSAANDVELTFSVRLDADTHFITKLHHQTPGSLAANSYHLVSAPARTYLARHDRVLAEARLGRGVWQRVQLRWIDQRLALHVNGRPCAQVSDNLLQSGHCVIGVTAGRAELQGIALRDVSAVEALRHGRKNPSRATKATPFTATPRRNLIYHVWPVRGATWRWNVEQLRSRIDLFNGRRIIGIVHDRRSEDPEEVRRSFAGHGCEFVVARNGPLGEGLTFPTMLESVRSLDPNEVTFYAHAKGVKYEPSLPASVRRWAEVQYRVALDRWPTVRAQLERFALTGSFKMLGRFRAHRYLGDWHYSGTFFWLRHACVFARETTALPGFYGCVEAWPGMHFRREETGCLFMDDLRQLPYHEEFWRRCAEPAFRRWEAERSPAATPAGLVKPPVFDGCATPRLEQHPAEFGWLLDEFAAAMPRRILTVGSMHGGAEWHLARRFRALSRDLHITAVDLVGRRELLATLADARRRFGQSIELVVGDSKADTTRARVTGPFDAVFIDGDHSYRGAQADVEFALGYSPRLIALHDIADSDWHARAGCCVSRVWTALRARYPTEERIVGEWGGIGLVRL